MALVDKSKKDKCKPGGRYYDPKPKDSANGLVKISFEMTRDTVRNRVKPMDISMVFFQPDVIAMLYYQFMIRSIPLMFVKVICGTLWILNFGFCDKTTTEALFCIADSNKRDRNDARGPQWILRDALYTATDILNITTLSLHQLPAPAAFRSTKAFHKKMEGFNEMQRLINDPKQRKRLFSVKTRWQSVPAFIDRRKVNKVSVKMTPTKNVFVDSCLCALDAMGYVVLIPISLFSNKEKHEDGYTIDALLILRLNGNDIAISFKYNEYKRMMLPSGFHLQRDQLILMCSLIYPTSNIIDVSLYFNGWKSDINDISIGNRMDDVNRFKASKKQCTIYRNGLQDIKRKLLMLKKMTPSCSKELLDLIESADTLLQNKKQYKNVQEETKESEDEVEKFKDEIKKSDDILPSTDKVLSESGVQSVSTMRDAMQVPKLNPHAAEFTLQTDPGVGILNTIKEDNVWGI